MSNVRPMNTTKTVLQLGIASVAVPAVGAAIGFLLQTAIPGCHCDGGAGCHGCGGLGDLTAFLIFGGFTGALAALIFVFPASLVLALVLSFFNKGQPAEPRKVDPRRIDDAIASAIRQFKDHQSVAESCPACGAPITIQADERHRMDTVVQVRTACSCGECRGKFNVSVRQA